MASTPATGACGDGQFGPIVTTTDCRGGFDFTVMFESAILNILPAACFLLLATFRLFQLSRQTPKVLSSAWRVLTLVSMRIAYQYLVKLKATKYCRQKGCLHSLCRYSNRSCGTCCNTATS